MPLQRNRFDQFKFDIGSYNDQAFSLNFDQSIAGADTYFKMSQQSVTGRVTYLYVTNLTVSTTNVSWSVARTNILMPLGVYLSEVYADDPTGSAQSIARGKITVSRSLFSWRRRCYDSGCGYIINGLRSESR